MIAVVTGSSGFIGSRLVEALLERGFTVRCLDTRPNHDVMAEKHRIETYTLDCTDLTVLSESSILDGADYVFHLAGITKALNLEEFRRLNVRPTENLLKLLAEKGQRLKRFLFMSSQAAAGPAPALDQPVTESDKTEPIEPYGQSKFEAETIVYEYRSTIPCTILRPSSIYGPRDVDFLQIFKQIRHHVSFYPGYRHNYISILYLNDLIDGILGAAQAQATEGRTYFLCADEPVTWQQIHNAIAQAMDRRVVEFNVPQFFVDFACRMGDAIMKLTGRYTVVNTRKADLSKSPYWICSAERAKHDFGFKTRFSLLEGMRETYRWYTENGWL
jgi:nucleoside-diphosphate-sugar epimerase